MIKQKIHLRARGVCINQQQEILLCSVKDQDWYFLPGGEVEVGENPSSALLRELYEEAGLSDCVVEYFIGGVTNQFCTHNSIQHELNLLFLLRNFNHDKVESKEPHICFTLMPLSVLPNIRLLPTTLHKALLKWLEDKNVFWIEY